MDPVLSTTATKSPAVTVYRRLTAMHHRPHWGYMKGKSELADDSGVMQRTQKSVPLLMFFINMIRGSFYASCSNNSKDVIRKPVQQRLS